MGKKKHKRELTDADVIDQTVISVLTFILGVNLLSPHQRAETVKRLSAVLFASRAFSGNILPKADDTLEASINLISSIDSRRL